MSGLAHCVRIGIVGVRTNLYTVILFRGKKRPKFKIEKEKEFHLIEYDILDKLGNVLLALTMAQCLCVGVSEKATSSRE